MGHSELLETLQLSFEPTLPPSPPASEAWAAHVAATPLASARRIRALPLGELYAQSDVRGGWRGRVLVAVDCQLVAVDIDVDRLADASLLHRREQVLDLRRLDARNRGDDVAQVQRAVRVASRGADAGALGWRARADAHDQHPLRDLLALGGEPRGEVPRHAVLCDLHSLRTPARAQNQSAAIGVQAGSGRRGGRGGARWRRAGPVHAG